MASPPTSGNGVDGSGRLRLLDPAGREIDEPVEWEPAFVEALIGPASWAEVTVRLNGVALPVALRRLAGEPRVLAEWPRSGPGRYRLELEGGGASEERVLTIRPRKISEVAYALMLDDLETRLPASIALAMQRAGGLAGLVLPPPGATTLAQEVQRLRRAVDGISGRPGLAAVLEQLAGDPHRVLRSVEPWSAAERARRPNPARLPDALRRPNNLDADRRPLRVLDARSEPTADVYENRLLLAFATQVDRRLRRIRRRLLASGPPDTLDEVDDLLRRLTVARRAAAFLDDVTPPAHLTTRLTMVLLKRPPYRAALEGFLEFHRSVSIRLEDPALEAPLENLPALYQAWGTLEVIDALLDVAPEAGFRVKRQQLVRRDAEGVFVRLLPDGIPAVELERQTDGTRVALIPERSYGDGRPLGSVGFSQRPDVAVEVTRPGVRTRVHLFDPKYKLDGEATDDGNVDGRPKKVDIDKMHAYRDAIRDETGRRVVERAAILYPGPEAWFGPGIAALRAYPGQSASLEAGLRTLLADALSGREHREANAPPGLTDAWFAEIEPYSNVQ